MHTVEKWIEYLASNIAECDAQAVVDPGPSTASHASIGPPSGMKSSRRSKLKGTKGDAAPAANSTAASNLMTLQDAEHCLFQLLHLLGGMCLACSTWQHIFSPPLQRHRSTHHLVTTLCRLPVRYISEER